MIGGAKPAVAVFVHRFPVLSETFVAQEASALSALGHRVHVEALRRPDEHEAPGPPDIPVRWVEDETRGERLRALLWLAARHPLRCLADVRRSRAEPARPVPLRQLAPRARRLAALTPDLHLHTHFATVVCDEAYRIGRLLGVPTSLTAHAYDIYVRPATLPQRLRRSHFSTSGCRYTVDHLREVAGPAHADSVHEQVMGVDPSAFERSGPLPGTRHVAAVGRLVEKKGFVHLIRAAALLGDVEVSIAGRGPEHGALAAEIERLGVGDRVSLVGALDPTGVRTLLERADLLCMPCVVAADGDRDSMPVVVKEAMAMQLMVVASDEVGLPELVEEPWGRLAAPADHEGLAEAIRALLAHDLERRRALGALARSHVARVADVRTETAKVSGWIARARAAR